MIVEWVCNTGFAGCDYKEEIEVDDNATDEEIDEIVREEVFGVIEWGWRKVDGS